MERKKRKSLGTHSFLYWYIGKEFSLAFFVCFLFFFFIFFINQMLLMAEDILSKHAPALEVLMLVVYALPSIVAMSFPFASLVGALMAVGRFSSDNEIIIFQASGISLKRMFIPFVLIALLTSCVSFVINDYFLPLGTINFGKLYRKLLSTTPALELKSYSVKKFQKSTIVVGEVEGGVIRDIMIFDTEEERKNRVITAKNARLVQNEEQGGVMSLDLEGVFTQVADPSKPDRFEYSSSERMIYNIVISQITDIIGSLSPREMSSVDVKRIIDEKSALLARQTGQKTEDISRAAFSLRRTYSDYARGIRAPFQNAQAALSPLSAALKRLKDEKLTDRSLEIYKLEYYKKFSIPFAALFFVFFSFPVGLFARRSGRSVGFGIGLLVSVIYWSLLVGGQTLGLRLGYSSFWSMWLPNLIVFATGIVFAIARFVV